MCVCSSLQLQTPLSSAGVFSDGAAADLVSPPGYECVCASMAAREALKSLTDREEEEEAPPCLWRRVQAEKHELESR